MNWHDDYQPGDLEVQVKELMVATADEADSAVDTAVPKVLRLLREKMNMDVVFVSEFTDGQRVFRHLDQAPGKEVLTVGASDPLEESWCQRVVDGRLPELVHDAGKLQARGELPATAFPVGTHLSTPIVLSNGEVYGTLCCFSFSVNNGANERDLDKLRYTAQLTARKIEEAHDPGALELTPVPHRGFHGKL